MEVLTKDDKLVTVEVAIIIKVLVASANAYRDERSHRSRSFLLPLLSVFTALYHIHILIPTRRFVLETALVHLCPFFLRLILCMLVHNYFVLARQ